MLSRVKKTNRIRWIAIGSALAVVILSMANDARAIHRRAAVPYDAAYGPAYGPAYYPATYVGPGSFNPVGTGFGGYCYGGYPNYGYWGYLPGVYAGYGGVAPAPGYVTCPYTVPLVPAAACPPAAPIVAVPVAPACEPVCMTRCAYRRYMRRMCRAMACCGPCVPPAMSCCYGALLGAEATAGGGMEFAREDEIVSDGTDVNNIEAEQIAPAEYQVAEPVMPAIEDENPQPLLERSL